MALWDIKTGAKIPYVLAVIVIAIGLISLLDWTLHTKPVVAATTHQPERFTELYFSNPNKLPSAVNGGQILQIGFTVHNVESRSMSYAYDVDLTPPSGQTIVLDHEQFSLLNGQSQPFTDKEEIPSFTGRAEISVVLINQPEAIHFWIVSTT